MINCIIALQTKKEKKNKIKIFPPLFSQQPFSQLQSTFNLSITVIHYLFFILDFLFSNTGHLATRQFLTSGRTCLEQVRNLAPCNVFVVISIIAKFM